MTASTPEQERTLDDIVIESFTGARDLLASIFNSDNVHLMGDYSKVLGALRMLSDETLEKVGRPVILRMFKEIKADPTTGEGQRKGLLFVDNIALAVQDAVQYMMGAAQQRAQATQALARGRGPQKVLGV